MTLEHKSVTKPSTDGHNPKEIRRAYEEGEEQQHPPQTQRQSSEQRTESYPWGDTPIPHISIPVTVEWPKEPLEEPVDLETVFVTTAAIL